MRVRLPDTERDLIERVLRFANLRHVTTTREVERLLAGAAVVQTGRAFKIIEPKNVEAYRRDREALREDLAAIASGNVRDRQRVTEKVDAVLRETVPTRLALKAGRIGFAYGLDGVNACCALALAFILDDGRGLTNRLGRCGKPGCGRFNLAFERRARVHCNEAHRREADKAAAPERARRWRASALRRRSRPK